MARKRAFAAILLLPVSLVISGVPPALGETLDGGGYLAELNRWSAATERLRQHPEEAASLKNQLPAAWSVRIEGQRFEVATGWLREGLSKIEGNPGSAREIEKDLRARLKAVRAEAEGFMQAPSMLSPVQARAELDNVLKRPEFRRVRGPSWLTRLRQQISLALTRLLERLFGSVPGFPRATRVVGWVLAIGLVLAFLIWLVRQFLTRPVAQGLGLIGPPAPAKSWQMWAREAVEAAAEGRFRDAVRLAYWAGVHRLEEAGLWKVERARTPREYVRLLDESHPQRESLASLTWRFERVWYGSETASVDDFRFTVLQLEKLGCPFPSIPATGSS